MSFLKDVKGNWGTDATSRGSQPFPAIHPAYRRILQQALTTLPGCDNLIGSMGRAFCKRLNHQILGLIPGPTARGLPVHLLLQHFRLPVRAQALQCLVLPQRRLPVPQ